MGSSGYGSFGNYRVRTGNNSIDGVGSETGSSSNQNGQSVQSVNTSHILLEDVAISEYFKNNDEVPAPGETVTLLSPIYNGRLAVKSDSTEEIIGNVPTKYNYLINAITKGITYVGSVVSSGTSPIPYVVVSLHA